MVRLSRRAVVAAVGAAAVGCGGRQADRGAQAGAGSVAEAGEGGAAARAAPADGPGFALVELFSSEGCSSCPPADALLAEIAADKRVRVIPLAFHVDYWDELGWRDPFASPLFTERQQHYSRGLGLRGLYTPQMVVNGRREFTGSDRRRAADAIEEALARPALVRLALGPERAAGAAREVPFRLEGSAPGAQVFVAAVEDALVSDVRRGENAGRKLRHEAVVRALASAPAAAEGLVRLSKPGRLVAWVQKPGSEVLGASEAPG